MQSYMPSFDKNTNNFFSGFQGIPPSRLGFVCKPDMPPHINILFRARPPLEYVPLPDKGKSRPYEGVVGVNKELLDKFEKNMPEKYIPDESKRILRLKTIVDKIEKHKMENREMIKEWSPKTDQNIQGDPYKTLFVYKIDHKTDEKKLKREFEMYGPIKRVRIVRDSEGKSRGYGFIEFEHKSDFKNAYKKAEKKKLDDSRVSVDYERGRTEKNWKPRRLGGGKGDSRAVPVWLEKELKEIKEMYPELIFKSKEEPSHHHKNRKPSRSRDKSSLKEDRTSITHVENINMATEFDSNVRMIQVQDNNIQVQSQTIHTDAMLSEPIEINMINQTIKEDDENTIKQDEELDQDADAKSSSRKKKKEKKERKEKKNKKDKKERKDKKNKRERNNKRSPEVEVGEII